MRDAISNVHVLKTWPAYYQDVIDGDKTFEIRYGDRPYRVGDMLDLQEWDPQTKEYTGRETLVRVTYLLEGGIFGLAQGYVAMAIKRI